MKAANSITEFAAFRISRHCTPGGQEASGPIISFTIDETGFWARISKQVILPRKTTCFAEENNLFCQGKQVELKSETTYFGKHANTRGASSPPTPYIYNNVHARTRKGFPNGERTFHSATPAHDDTRHAMLKKLKISPSQPSCEKLFLLLPIQNINENLNFNPHKNMKLGIIRCQQTEDYCPGSGCFKAVGNRKGAFAEANEDIEIIGFANCGGCPGKKAVLRVHTERHAHRLSLSIPRQDEETATDMASGEHPLAGLYARRTWGKDFHGQQTAGKGLAWTKRPRERKRFPSWG